MLMMRTAINSALQEQNTIHLDKKKENLLQETHSKELFDVLGVKEFENNVEMMYASTIYMSSTCCASGTCD